MKVIPYLTFENTIEAIKYYETIFGEILVKRMPMTEEMAKGMGVEGDISGKTLHSELNFGGSLVYASDCFGESNPIHPVSLFLSFDKDITIDTHISSVTKTLQNTIVSIENDNRLIKSSLFLRHSNNVLKEPFVTVNYGY